MSDDYDYLTQEQLAARLDVSIDTLKTWEIETVGPAPQTLNGETVYALAEVLEHERREAHILDIMGPWSAGVCRW